MGTYPYHYMRLTQDIEDTELKKDDIVMVIREYKYDALIQYVNEKNDIRSGWILKEFLKPLVQ